MTVLSDYQGIRLKYAGISRAATFGFLLFMGFLAIGCKSIRTPRPVPANGIPNAAAVSERLQAIVANGTLPELKWPNFTDFRPDVQALYQSTQFSPAWIHGGQATPQALAMIAIIQGSQAKGLNPDDYDASRWSARVGALKSAPTNAETAAHFDADLTVDAMRFISNLHVGRLNPEPRKFGMDLDQKHYDLPQFLLAKVLSGADLTTILNQVEPQYLGYKRTETALQTYLSLAAQDQSTTLPDVQRPINAGAPYAGIDALAQRLRILGDIPQTASVDANNPIYGGPLVDAMKHFQIRHGINPDGRITIQTIHELNVPLSSRIAQLDDSLERWRWLPSDYQDLPVAVNIPGFKLRVFTVDHHVAMRMNVVVGKAFRHQTPVFAKEMKYIVFRPYWNLPLDITRADIVPKLRKDPHYLARKGYEVTDQKGGVVSSGVVNSYTLNQIQAGRLLVRQKPGPSNSLGLVKFMFPNEYAIYLHSTPAPQLFNETRRDFSHGCIRVEKPAELAAWLLQDQPIWTLARIKEAMQSGPDNQSISTTTSTDAIPRSMMLWKVVRTFVDP